MLANLNDGDLSVLSTELRLVLCLFVEVHFANRGFRVLRAVRRRLGSGSVVAGSLLLLFNTFYFLEFPSVQLKLVLESFLLLLEVLVLLKGFAIIVRILGKRFVGGTYHRHAAFFLRPVSVVASELTSGVTGADARVSTLAATPAVAANN
jgi:hypothetical protein